MSFLNTITYNNLLSKQVTRLINVMHPLVIDGFSTVNDGSNAVVSRAIIACKALQFLHAIIACFQTCSKILMRQKCCSQ